MLENEAAPTSAASASSSTATALRDTSRTSTKPIWSESQSSGHIFQAGFFWGWEWGVGGVGHTTTHLMTEAHKVLLVQRAANALAQQHRVTTRAGAETPIAVDVAKVELTAAAQSGKHA